MAAALPFAGSAAATPGYAALAGAFLANNGLAAATGEPRVSPYRTVKRAEGASAGFSAAQYAEAYSEGVERHFWNAARNRIIASELGKVARGSGPLGKILEIGCGAGVVVRHLRQRGFDCHGAELAAAPIAADLKPFIATNVDATTLDPSFRESIGTILLLDVIEHVEVPVQFLRGILAAFPMARRVLLTVPARRELWSNYDEHYGHYRRYDMRSLRAFIRDADLRLERAAYLFHALYPAMLLNRLTRRARTVVIEPPRHERVHRLLAVLFAWEARLLPAALPGTSILAVACRGASALDNVESTPRPNRPWACCRMAASDMVVRWISPSSSRFSTKLKAFPRSLKS
ncbi:MAG: methyltransferase domain-containing protein [Proteobacteria bacterium]|nr:methyltransferase domain-containing protein [Pseudomonadota bacterium]